MSRRCNSLRLGAAVCAGVFALAFAPGAVADPDAGGSEDPQVQTQAPVQLSAGEDGSQVDATPESACGRFAQAVDGALWRYMDFAQVTGTPGWSYQDPIVANTNVDARTALRQSMAEVLEASRTAGLAPDVASAMRDWSVHATKLLMVMGLRRGGDTILNTATQLDADTNAVQMACMNAGTPALRPDA